MCMQKFIKIFHSVQEIGPFSLFQNLALGKASTDDKCHFAIPWARTFQHHIMWKVFSKYSKFQVNVPFFQNLTLGKTSTNPKCHLTISFATSCQYQCVCKISSQYSRPMKNDISQSLWLDLVNINIYTKVNQNIPFSLRDRAIFNFSEFGARQSLNRW